jgi:hypothetical protein
MVAGLDQFLERYPPTIVELTRRLTGFLDASFPQMSATVRQGWGTVNYKHSRAGFVCAVYPTRDHVSLILQQGRMLASPLLKGDGENLKQVRYIPLMPGGEFPEDEMAILLVEAIALKA